MALNKQEQLYHISRSAVWHDSNFLTSHQFDRHIWQWLDDRQSLTQRLLDVSSGDFSVDLLDQKIGVPLRHEQDSLGQGHHLAAAIREVCLNVFSEPIVLARSVIPLTLIKQHQNGLTSLGRQPLGQLLFKEGKVRVSKRQFVRLEAPIGTVYGRKTPYEYAGSMVLVSEFYLPRIREFRF